MEKSSIPVFSDSAAKSNSLSLSKSFLIFHSIADGQMKHITQYFKCCINPVKAPLNPKEVASFQRNWPSIVTAFFHAAPELQV